jgi:mRNA interferase MazF
MDGLKRGDVVTLAGSGDFAGKPRPAVINDTHATTLIDALLFRVDVRATKQNGLRADSQAMVDKIASVRRDRIARRVGALSPKDTARIEEALGLWLAL